MRIYVADKETGTFIEEVKDIDSGKHLIRCFEADDKREGTYKPGFYDVVNENHESLL